MYKIGDLVETKDGNAVVMDISFAISIDPFKIGVASEGDLAYYLGYSDNDGRNEWVYADDVASKWESNSFFDEDMHSPELLKRGYNMLAWIDGLEDRPDNSKLPEIVTFLMAIQYDKEGHYGSSWKGKGEYRGIMANIDRKYDRLDKMTNSEISGTRKALHVQEQMLSTDYELYSEEVGESKVDAIADLTNYCLLYMTYIRENYPNVFKVWVDKNIPQYLRDKIPFV